MKSEIHAIIIWEKARGSQNEIIKDLETKFSILKIFEVYWSAPNFSKNLSRLYGLKLKSTSYKMDRCGTGPFLLILIEDCNPSYEERNTLSGKKLVNINTFDSKIKYRKLTGGEQKIHTTISQQETSHEIALILGKTLDEIRICKKSTEIETIRHDLAGTNGWESLTEFFRVLNCTFRYVVLRNFEGLPHSYNTGYKGDIDILVDEFSTAIYVSNGVKRIGDHYTQYFVQIEGKKVLFDFFHVGDNYFDKKFELDILNRRKYSEQGFFIPNEEDYFYSLLYHNTVHKAKVKDKEKLAELAKKLGINDINHNTITNSHILKIVLDRFLEKHEYSYVRPNDKYILYNYNFTGKKDISHNRKFSLGELYIVRAFNKSILIIKSEGIMELFRAIKARIQKKMLK